MTLHPEDTPLREKAEQLCSFQDMIMIERYLCVSITFRTKFFMTATKEADSKCENNMHKI